MKTKKLIAALQAADPGGERECCIDSKDIVSVATQPAYWDGSLQTLQWDPTTKIPQVVGAKVTRVGEKVLITAMPISEFFESNPNLPVDYSEASEADRRRLEKDRARARADLSPHAAQNTASRSLCTGWHVPHGYTADQAERLHVFVATLWVSRNTTASMWEATYKTPWDGKATRVAFEHNKADCKIRALRAAKERMDAALGALDALATVPSDLREELRRSTRYALAYFDSLVDAEIRRT